MKLRLPPLLQSTAIYMAFDILAKAIPFALLPILTRYLTPTEYGVVAMFTILQSLLAPLIGLNTAGGITVFFFRMERGDFRKFVGAVLLVLLVTSLAVFSLVSLFVEPIARLFELDDVWVLLAVAAAIGQFVTLINLTLWQVEENPKAFGIYQLSQTVVNISFALYLVVVLKQGVDGRLWSIFLPAVIFGVLSLWVINRRGFVDFCWSPDLLRRALRFGVPLIPHAFSSIAKSSADRLIITSLVGLQATGIYSVAWQFGNIIFLLAYSFNKAFAPYLFRLLKEGDAGKRRILVRYTYIYFAVIFLLAVLLGWVARLFVPLILGEGYADAAALIIWIAIAFSFDGMYFMVVNYIFYEGRTDLLAPITAGGAVLHISLSYVFVGEWGGIGAAYAQIASGIVVFALVWLVSMRVHYMPWFSREKK